MFKEGLVHEVSPPPRVGRLTASFAALAVSVATLTAFPAFAAEDATTTALIITPQANNTPVGSVSPAQYVNTTVQSVHSVRVTGMIAAKNYNASGTFTLKCDGTQLDIKSTPGDLISPTEENGDYFKTIWLSGVKSLQRGTTRHTAEADSDFRVNAIGVGGYSQQALASQTIWFNVGPFVAPPVVLPPGGN